MNIPQLLLGAVPRIYRISELLFSGRGRSQLSLKLHPHEGTCRLMGSYLGLEVPELNFIPIHKNRCPAFIPKYTRVGFGDRNKS